MGGHKVLFVLASLLATFLGSCARTGEHIVTPSNRYEYSFLNSTLDQDCFPAWVTYMNSNGSSPGVVKVNWGTNGEYYCYGFIVEKLDEEQGEDYVPISELIPGHGTTTEPQNYTFTDYLTIEPSNYYAWYRLKHIGLNGCVRYEGPVLLGY